jgi:hypothetical protein
MLVEQVLVGAEGTLVSLMPSRGEKGVHIDIVVD